MASQESVIFQEFYATLLEAVKPEISLLVADLYSRFLIGETTKDFSGSEREKAKALLDDLESRIKTKPSVLQEFVSVLELNSSLTLSDVAERIKLRLLERDKPTTVPQSRSASEPTQHSCMVLPFHSAVSQAKSLPPGHHTNLYTFNITVVSPDRGDPAVLSNPMPSAETPLVESPLAAQGFKADSSPVQQAITIAAGSAHNEKGVTDVRDIAVSMPVVHSEPNLAVKEGLPGLFQHHTGKRSIEEEEGIKVSELYGPSVVASDSQSKEFEEEAGNMHLQPPWCRKRVESIEDCLFLSLSSTNSEDLDDIEDRLAKCKIEYEKLQEKKEKAISRKVDKQQRKVDQIRKEKSKLEEQLAKTELELDEQIERCEQLRSSLTRQEELSAQLQSQLNQARKEGTQLKMKLGSTLKTATQFHVQMTQSKQAYERLLAEHRASDPYYAQLKESEKKRAELEAENDKLYQKLNDYATKISVLEKEVEMLIEGREFDPSFQLDHEALQSALEAMPADDTLNGL